MSARTALYSLNRSIFQAVWRVSSRKASISIHESATISWTSCLLASTSPWVYRDTARSQIMSKIRRTKPTVRIA
jgi:hypothetical protein